MNSDKLKQINEIRDAVLKCETQMNNLLQQFGWSKEELPVRKIIKAEIIEASTSAEECKSQQKDKKICHQIKDETIDLDALANLCAKIDKKSTFLTNYADINKLKRDLKRRRMKHRTTKTAPLTYTEELRELISLQMELVKERK